jgi:predicted Zn-dependent protease
MQRMQGGDLAGAQASFDTALRLNPEFVPAYLALVEMDQKAGNFAQGVARLETLRRAAPKTPHVLCREAELYLASGRFVKGIETAQAALQSEPDCPLARAQLGLALDAAGKTEDALAAMEAAHRGAPRSARITLALAQMRARAGRAAEAWNLLDSLAASPQSPVQANYLRGWLLAEAGRGGRRDETAALEALNRALASAPRDGPSLLEKGRILLRQGDIAAASVNLEAALRESGPSVEGLAALAEARRRQGKPDAMQLARATQDFARFQDALHGARQHYLADPESRENLLRLARLEASQGNGDDAEEMLNRLLQRDPNDAQALALLVACREGLPAPPGGRTPPREGKGITGRPPAPSGEAR